MLAARFKLISNHEKYQADPDTSSSCEAYCYIHIQAFVDTPDVKKQLAPIIFN
jgi:hypothetical protein